MTDYETLAALGFTEPVAKTSEPASLPQQTRPDGVAVAHPDAALPSRRSLRGGGAVTDLSASMLAAAALPAPDVAAAPAPVAPALVAPVAAAAVAPAAPGSRRAAREAREAASVGIPAVPVAPQQAVPFVPTAPQVAAPFGTLAAPDAEVTSRRALRESAHHQASSGHVPPRAAQAPRTASVAVAPASRTVTTRKRLSAAGTMVLVGGLFVSLTLPAYASNDFSGELADGAAAKTGAQTLALDETAIEAASTVQARDGYDSTSAADLKRLYRDALRQQRMAEYLASGAKELGDDYPWATELGMGQGGGLSPLRYFVRQCTDFVAWRLNRDAGSTRAPFKYDWSYLTPGGGSAHSWKSQWEKHGWAVSSTPAAGWVAWFPGGNHVSYVNSVLPDGSVLIEEYNWGPDTYNQRIIPASSALYLAPPPR